MNISDLAATNMSNIIDSMFDDDSMGVLLDPIAMGQAINATASPAPTVPIYRGFLFLLGSSFLWGSNYVPVKHFETGDGMFFQFIVCIGIWLVGFIVFWLRQFPKFYALPLLGGFLWSTGNVNSVPIIKTIGLALGMLIWNVVGLVTGWATARFGLFGLEKDVPSNVVLNFIGVALAASSTVLYLFVKADMSHGKLKPSEITITNDSEKDTESGVEKKNSAENHENHDGILGRQSLRTKRIIGSVLAIFSGIMYGQYNTPILYTNQQFNKEGNYLDMLFCFYTGILLSSLGYFLIYCLIKKNNPRIYPKTIIPGLVSGVMWGLATICYFNATDILNQATSFPIASSGPPIFSSLWSILLYKEIKGSRNFAILFTGFLIAITGSILIGLSF